MWEERDRGGKNGVSGKESMNGNTIDMNGKEDTANGKHKTQVLMGEGAQCIWLARVRPVGCEGIIKNTILQGKVVKPERQLRDGVDRGRGFVSW